MGFNEEQFARVIKPHILRCRAGDWEHAQRVVYWVKKLGKDRSDLSVFIVAAYVHDLGWRDVLPRNDILSREELKRSEPEANDNSEKYIKELLAQLNHSEEDIEVVLHLVNAADAHRSQNEDEAIIVDADNLSKLCIKHLREKYRQDNWMAMYNLWKEEFPERIQTEYGKSVYPELLLTLRNDIIKSIQDKLVEVQFRFLRLLEEIPDKDWDSKLAGENWTMKQEMVHIVQVVQMLPAGIERASRGSKRSFLGSIPVGLRNWVNGHIIIPLKARSETRASVARAYQNANKALVSALEELTDEDWDEGMPYPRKYRTVEQMAYRPIEHFEEHEGKLRRLLEMGRDLG